jgi:hypothetical protein
MQYNFIYKKYLDNHFTQNTVFFSTSYDYVL